MIHAEEFALYTKGSEFDEGVAEEYINIEEIIDTDKEYRKNL